MVQGGLKHLGDLPRDTWIEAADGCDLCGARHQVKVRSVEGHYGEADIRIIHRPHCPATYDEDPGGPDGYGVCDRQESAGWEYGDQKIILGGQEWTPIVARADVALCLGCGRLVVDGLIILFIDEGRGGELDLCPGCALELGVFDNLGRQNGG